MVKYLHTFDLHVHTENSGDSPCSVSDAIEAAKKRGLSGIAITDHNSVSGLEEAAKLVKGEDFLIIPGIEVSSKDGHILGLGIDEVVPRDLPASEVVERIRGLGGIAVSAHPFGLGPKPFSLLKADFDAVEVFNPRRILGNFLASNYASKHEIAVTGGSDSHFREEVGLAGIKLDCKLEVEDILKKIKQGRASVFGQLLPLSGYIRRLLFRFPLTDNQY